jgi:hypothetical protein
LIFVVGFLVLAKHERIGCFMIGGERMNEVLPPDGFTFGAIGELSSTGKFLRGSLEHRIIDNDVAIL